MIGTFVCEVRESLRSIPQIFTDKPIVVVMLYIRAANEFLNSTTVQNPNELEYIYTYIQAYTYTHIPHIHIRAYTESLKYTSKDVLQRASGALNKLDNTHFHKVNFLGRVSAIVLLGIFLSIHLSGDILKVRLSLFIWIDGYLSHKTYAGLVCCQTCDIRYIQTLHTYLAYIHAYIYIHIHTHIHTHAYIQRDNQTCHMVSEA